MTARLPLFPLGTVLFPGLVLPLHVFEPRYRDLVRDLLALPAGQAREFGVVAIQRGWEVGAEAVAGDATAPATSATLTLHEVGCTAEIRQVTELPDGRFDLTTVGRRRFWSPRWSGCPSRAARRRRPTSWRRGCWPASGGTSA